MKMVLFLIITNYRYAEQRPDLLCGEYTWREYQREPKFLDLGKQIMYRDAFMVGWAVKTLTKEDLRTPIISGDGKRVSYYNNIYYFNSRLC